MKHRNFSILTFGGLLFILVLQILWLWSVYTSLQRNVYKECNSILLKSIRRELSIRFQRAPKGTEIVSVSIPSNSEQNDLAPEIIPLNEGLLKLGFDVSVYDIDSISSSLLKEVDIVSSISINRIDIRNKKILSASNSQVNVISWGLIKSKIIPITRNNLEGIQMVLVSPYRLFLRQMGLLILVTMLIVAFVIFCIVYQFRIISHMNKISRIREDFSYALIHDMKNPLSTIFTTLNFLHTGRLDDKPEKREKYFRIAEGEVDHLLTLTNKVLTVSKLEQHKLDMQKEKIELPPMIDKLVDKFTAKADKPTRFIKDLQATEVYADAEYLEEVLDNLIDNAVKYSKENVEITLSSSCNGRHTFLRVHDNGIGISDKDQKVIFNKYERGAAGRRKRKQGASGFGLGLNFVQQVVEAHGGNIFVNSIEGEFTEFVISLPLPMES